MSHEKFKKGFVLGGLLAAAALIGLAAATKQGQELGDELSEDLEKMLKKLRKKMEKLEEVTKDKYDEVVQSVVDEYAEKKQLADETKQKFLKAFERNWNKIQTESEADESDDQDEEDKKSK